MKCLVTGSSGFIGKHLCKALKKEGHVVIEFDHKNGMAQNLLIGNLNSKMEGVDIVFHLAALLDVRESELNPKEYFNSNVTCTVSVLDAMKKNNVKKIIFASSSAIYGTYDTQFEDQIPLPESIYGLSKFLCERVLDHYFLKHGIKSICLRMFNVYGDGQEKGVIPAFLNCNKNNKPPTIYGDGSIERDFIHVDDVIKTMLKSMTLFGKVAHNKINVGSGESTSINKLAELLKCQPPIYRPGDKSEMLKTKSDPFLFDLTFGS